MKEDLDRFLIPLFFGFSLVLWFIFLTTGDTKYIFSAIYLLLLALFFLELDDY